MSIKSFLFLTLFALYSLFGCKSTEKIEKLAFTITLQRTACFGTCPIYKMTLNDKGEVILTGERFLDKIGNYKLQLTPGDARAFAENLDKIHFFDFADEYDAGVSDLPSSYVTYERNGVKKRVHARYNYPTELSEFIVKMDSLLNHENWISLSID